VQIANLCPAPSLEIQQKFNAEAVSLSVLQTLARNPTKSNIGSIQQSAQGSAKRGVRRFEPGTRPFLHLCRADMRFRGDDLAIAGSFEVQRSAGARR